MGNESSGISRRSLMGALGGALAGGAAVASDITVAAAAAEPRNAFGIPVGATTGSVRPSTVRPLSPGLSYAIFSQFDFRASDPTVIGVQGLGFFSAPGSFAAASLSLPLGTRVRELTAYVANTTPYDQYLEISRFPLDLTGPEVTVAYVTAPAATALTTPLSLDCDFTVEPGCVYAIVMSCYDERVGVGAVQIGYQNTGSYTPVTPYRCYDSRFDAAGRVSASSTRPIDVTVSIDPADGTPLDSGMIPSDARAITFNLVAAGATGSNNFAIAAGDVVTPGASHLAFSLQTPTVANAGTVDISSGTVNVFGGGGSGAAHCIVDITGYYI